MTPQELKASILQLAVQGKLVEQHPEEGTGEELYQQIQVEKQRLIKEGKIKKENLLPEIAEDEIPFDIPESWKWVRLGDYCQKVTDQVASGSFATLRENVPSLKEPNYAIMVKTADFSNGFTRNLTYTTKHGYEFLENSNLFGGELILSNIGSIGKCFVVPDLDSKMTLAPNAVMVRLVNSELRDYLYYFIMSPQGYQALLSITSGTAMKKFNKTDLKKVLLPIPPVPEQKRIVAKIEELLPYIDRYEQAWSKLEDFNKRFPVDMQKSILQMAIQGKLVEQRPEEGTGEELYQQIKAENQRLIKACKIKKEKPLPEIAEDEIPFDIPESWKWVRLGAVIDMLSGFAFKSSDFMENGRYRLLRGINLSVGNTRWDDTVYVDEVTEKLKTFQILKGDVLIGLDRPWISDGIRVAIYDEDEETYLVQRVLRIRETSAITKEYIALLLRSNLFRNSVEGETTGISVPHISPSQVGNVAIPLPPLAEQKRIVAKLEEILPLCERLK